MLTADARMTARIVVAVGERVREPLQHDDPEPVREDGARGVRVERAAVAVGRPDEPVLVQIAALLRKR